MKTYLISITAVLVILASGYIQGQNLHLNSINLLNKPKDIAYDSVRQCSYITNFGNSSVVRIDSVGNQEYILEGINKPMGLHLSNDTLIITSNTPSKLTVFNVTSNQIIYELPVPTGQYLNMMDKDPLSGFLYIVDQIGAIYKFDYRDLICSIFVPVSSGIYYGSQTIEVDTANTRLLVFKWDAGYIRGVDLNDSSQVTNVAPQQISQIQSSQKGVDGCIYVTSYLNNGVYKYDSDLGGTPEEITSGLAQPSGIAYNKLHNSLLVCNYGGNSISEISLDPLHVCESSHGIDVNIYPNPSKGKFLMTIEGVKEKTSVKMYLMDYLGNFIWHKIERSWSNQIYYPIDITAMPNGTYYLLIEVKKGQIITRNLVKTDL